MAASADIGLFGVLVKVLSFPWFSSALISFLLATTINYLLSVRFVFRSGIRFNQRHEILLVFAVNGLGLAINQGVLWIAIDRMNWEPLLGKVIATGFVFFWNYGIRRHLIFSSS